MPLALRFLEFTLLLWLSYGAPPGKKTNYSNEEEEFIIKKLESHTSSYNTNMWRVVAEAHSQKVEDRAPGFMTKRSPKALRSHFCAVMKNKKAKVSDTVKLLRHAKRNKAYSHEEEEFLNTELMSHQGTLYGDFRWEEIKKQHDKNRELGLSGFSIKRSAAGLRMHFKKYMVPRGLVHEDVKSRFPDYFKCNQGVIVFEGVNQSEYETSDSWCRYSSQEHQLMIEMLKQHANTYNTKTWKTIEEAHKRKVEANDPGFFTPRSSHALYQHFINFMKRDDTEVPDTVKLLYDELMNCHYTPNEVQFINKRTWTGLRTFFQKRMVPNDMVDEAVKGKFPNNFRIEQGSTSVGGANHPNENAEIGGEVEHEVWDTILEDLNRSQRSPVKSTRN